MYTSVVLIRFRWIPYLGLLHNFGAFAAIVRCCKISASLCYRLCCLFADFHFYYLVQSPFPVIHTHIAHVNTILVRTMSHSDPADPSCAEKHRDIRDYTLVPIAVHRAAACGGPASRTSPACSCHVCNYWNYSVHCEHNCVKFAQKTIISLTVK